MPDRDVDTWFVEEVLVWEAALVRFLRRSWRNADEVPDLRQEVYARVYEAACRKRPASIKSFLFTTARNLMIDRARRAQVVSFEMVADFERLSVLDRVPDAEEILSSRQELQALHDALQELPPRCREVVSMRKIEGRSQREVAAILGIAESTVEKQVSKGVRILTEALYGEDGAYRDDSSGRARAYRERSR